MKHLSKIQTEFAKYAAKWDELSLEEQKEYMKKHPKTKKRLTAKPKESTKFNTPEEYDAEISKLQQGKQELHKQIIQKRIETTKPDKTTIWDIFDNAMFERWDDETVDTQIEILKHNFPKKTKLIEELESIIGNVSNDRFDAENSAKHTGELVKLEKSIEKGAEKAEKLFNKIFE